MLRGPSNGVRCPAMNVQWAEVAHDSLLLLKANVAKVLVAENESSALGCVQSKLIQSLRSQLRELYATDLGSDVWGEIVNPCRFRQEVEQGRVSSMALWESVFSSLVD